MGPQRYERIGSHDEDQDNTSIYSTPNSPPPSFHSRTSSLLGRTTTNPSSPEREPLVSDADRELADTFDSPSDDEPEDESASSRLDDRQRVMSGRPSNRDTASPTGSEIPNGRPPVERRVTQLPVFSPAPSRRTHNGASGAHDGVFANMSAKPERGEEIDEKPPSYEQAAADATPPYWETTILTPGGATSDDVFIDGLPVGSFFSFVWNGMISMSFQLVGFLLTYLLHTTHAAKNGSKAGLGITLIQYGFSMKRDGSASTPPSDAPKGSHGDQPGGNGDGFVPPPNDPNSHDFDPNAAVSAGAVFVSDTNPGAGAGGVSGMKAMDWLAYALMLVGWFILIRAISEYFKARRHEQLVLQSPSRGLNVAVVAEGEPSENTV